MKIISGEKYLIDTNVLVYAVDAGSPFFSKAKSLIELCRKNGGRLAVAHQNLLEFTAVMDRVYRLPRKDILADARSFSVHFEVIYPGPKTFQTFLGLMSGEAQLYPFDVYLAATMLDNGISRIITANAGDFRGLGLEEVVDMVGQRDG